MILLAQNISKYISNLFKWKLATFGWRNITWLSRFKSQGNNLEIFILENNNSDMKLGTVKEMKRSNQWMLDLEIYYKVVISNCKELLSFRLINSNAASHKNFKEIVNWQNTYIIVNSIGKQMYYGQYDPIP